MSALRALVAPQGFFVHFFVGAEIMTSRKTPSGTQAHAHYEIRDATTCLAKHVLAIVAGFIMTVAGLGMGVTMVLLPIGIPVGLVGVVMLIWGFADWNRLES
jgi:hypothetical protein